MDNSDRNEIQIIRCDENGDIQSAEGYNVVFQIDENNKAIKCRWVLNEQKPNNF